MLNQKIDQLTKKRLQRLIIPAAVFIVALLVLGYLVHRAAPPPKMVSVVITTTAVPAGATVSGADVRTVLLRAEDAPPWALHFVVQAMGKPAKVTMVAGQPVFPTDLGTVAVQHQGLLPGQEGADLKVSNPNEVAGLSPGDWIGVYAVPSHGAGQNLNATAPGMACPLFRARIVALYTAGGQQGGAASTGIAGAVSSNASTPISDVRLALTPEQAATLIWVGTEWGGANVTVAPWSNDGQKWGQCRQPPRHLS